jgi:hypothetical protein
MKKLALLSSAVSLLCLLGWLAGCSGCALFRAEGEATFFSMPENWPGVYP